jgi:RNA polymerase sigma-70 factor (ECF subfamily)
LVAEERIERPEKRSVESASIQVGSRRDDDLVRSALSSREALESLCEQYIPKIYSYILRRVGGVEDAEDITSTVFEKVLANLDGFDSRKASFATWIYRIATNCVTDFYRSRGRKREVSLEEEQASASLASEDGLDGLHSYMALLELMKQLSPKYQEALALRYFAELSVNEVAESLEISETAASKRILRGLDSLRKLASGGPLEELM